MKEYFPGEHKKNNINIADLVSFTYICPTCHTPVTTTGPRELLDKTERECNICRLKSEDTWDKILEQQK